MNMVKRAASLLMAVALAGASAALAEDDHFVPENPDQMPAESEVIALDLSLRASVFGQGTGEDEDGGVRLAGGSVNKVMFPMPFALKAGQIVTVTITGRFNTAQDQSVRVYLTSSVMDNCAAAIQTIANPGGEIFTATFDLTAEKDTDRLMLASSSFADWFQDFTLLSLSVDSALGQTQAPDGSVSYEQAAGESWYQELLRSAQLNLGNNKRLLNMIRRAQAGEQITIATIGGSITEGAGADRYRECYAYQIYEGFRARYGAGDGSNVSFVNAGVGGTPSTFGWMRYQRDIVDRVTDADGLPDIVVVEYAVNDGGEPTIHQCYESMVRAILAQPNEPVVILLFSVFPTGYTLQRDLAPVGFAADLMMVSMADSAFRYVGKKWTKDAFFFDIYHPTTLGHRVMADCVLEAIAAAAALPESEQDVDLNAEPAYGLAYMDLHTIFRERWEEGIALALGSFSADDETAYRNLPIGRVCGRNFHHRQGAGGEPMTFDAAFHSLLIAYRTVTDDRAGNAEVWVDGVRRATLVANTGSWGQSVVDLVFHEDASAPHHVEIRMAEGDEEKKFTITCMAFAQ